MCPRLRHSHTICRVSLHALAHLDSTLHMRACRPTRCACRTPWLIRLSHDTPHGTPAQGLGRFHHPFNITVLLLHPSCTRHSRGRRVRCSGSALAATESARVYLKDTTRTCNSKRTHTTQRCSTVPIYATYPAMYPRCLCARRVSLDITPLLSFRPCRTGPPGALPYRSPGTRPLLCRCSFTPKPRRSPARLARSASLQ